MAHHTAESPCNIFSPAQFTNAIYIMQRISLLLLSLLLGISSLSAQCSAPNSAFQDGETLNYELYFNWAFVWIKVGQAQWSIRKTSYAGQPAYRTYLTTSTNKRADKFFVMRDTLTAYTSHAMTPLFYTKHAHEGKYFRVDQVKYSYPKGKCRIDMDYSANYGAAHPRSLQSTECIFDMVSMMLRARSFDPRGWQPGQRQYFIMADGKDCKRQSIVYRGKKNFKMENSNTTYRCLVFSFMEQQEKSKEKEIVRFYITDDANHLPVRLDMNLSFGTAKAFLKSASGVRNPQTAVIKS